MIVVFGSLNMDMVMPVQAMPRPGETVLCSEYKIVPGGKGANQALAATRAGASVCLFGKVGNDEFGRTILSSLKKDNVNVTGVQSIEDSTGYACVCVDKKGENMVMVASGANRAAKEKDVPQELLTPQTTLIVQMETPAEENWNLITRAHKAGARTILNLAPAQLIPPSVLKCISVIVLNQIESTVLAVHLGFDVISPTIAAQRISSEYNTTCVVTLGSEGALACTPQGIWSTEAMEITPVDTTSAGDAFVGVFAASLDKGNDTALSLRRATVASGLACLTMGAMTSLPYDAEIKASLSKIPPPRRRP